MNRGGTLGGTLVQLEGQGLNDETKAPVIVKIAGIFLCNVSCVIDLLYLLHSFQDPNEHSSRTTDFVIIIMIVIQ